MTITVRWTKTILEEFLEESGLNDRIAGGDEKARILAGILRTRCAGGILFYRHSNCECHRTFRKAKPKAY